MSDIIKIFFELIRIAIGAQDRLSWQPNVGEWSEIFMMAKKQSLVGVCFAAIQRLLQMEDSKNPTGSQQSHSLNTINIPKALYLKWIGMAAKIQQKNEILNEQCIALQKQLFTDGIASRILKGQGVSKLYTENLHGLRQSGDIDLWMIASKEEVVSWAEKNGMTEEAGYLHVGVRVFPYTEVELHYRPTYMRSLRHNKRLQKFCEEHKNSFELRENFVVPSLDFDVVYQLSHIYRHLFGLGVGLRQLMDYYFLLINVEKRKLTMNFPLILSRLGLLKFASAVMYVMREVFHMEEQYMICEVDEKRGKMLLCQVMRTGNFGHQDEKQREARSTAFGSLFYKLKQWIELVQLYPEETLSAPLWSFYVKVNIE